MEDNKNYFFQLWRDYELICDVDSIEYTITRQVSPTYTFNGSTPVFNLGKSTVTGSFKVYDLSLMSKVDTRVIDDYSSFDLVFFAESIMKSNIYIVETRFLGTLIECSFSGTGLVQVPTELRYLVEITKRQTRP
jgi:hypothetical protein